MGISIFVGGSAFGGGIAGLWTTTDDGTDYLATLSNPRNSAGADAIASLMVGGTSAGDAYYQAGISGGVTYAWGVDNSDSDAWVLSRGTAGSATPGTNNAIRIEPGAALGTGAIKFDPLGTGVRTIAFESFAGTTGIPAGVIIDCPQLGAAEFLTILPDAGGTAGKGLNFSVRDTSAASWKRILQSPNRSGPPIVDMLLDGGYLRLTGGLQHRKGADVASATTLTFAPDLGNVRGVTGTTTVNHLTTTDWQAGSRVTFVTTGALQITHNAGSPPANTAPFLNASGANITTAASRAYSYVFDGTNWIQD